MLYYLLPNFLKLKEAISLFFIIGNRSWKNICYTKVLWKFTTLSWSHKRKLPAIYCRDCLQKKILWLPKLPLNMTFEEYILAKPQYSIVTYLYRTIHTRHSKEARIKDPNFVVTLDAWCIKDRGINPYAQLFYVCTYLYFRI